MVPNSGQTNSQKTSELEIKKGDYLLFEYIRIRWELCVVVFTTHLVLHVV